MALRLFAAIVPSDSCGMQSYSKKNVIRNIKREGLCLSLKGNATKFCTLMCFYRSWGELLQKKVVLKPFVAPEESGGNLINRLQ